MEDVDEIYEIDLKEYLSIIWNKKWIIILVTLIAVILSAFVSFFILEPVYESSTTIIVGKSNDSDRGIEYEDIMLNQKLVDTYSVVIKSKSVLSQVISNLELNLTSDQLKNKITVNPVAETEIIEIKVEDTNPILATDIANDTAGVFMEQVTSMMQIDNIQIIDMAYVPINPIKPNKSLNIAISAVLGMMIGLGIVFLREYLDNTFKSSKDSEKYLELPTIGVIPIMDKDMEKGLTQPISVELPNSVIAESYKALRTNLKFSSVDKDLKTLTITSTGKSEGKSTIISNIAATMAQDNSKVLLVDCDFRRPTIHKKLYVSNLYGLSSILTKQSTKEEAIQETSVPGLDVLTSGPKPPNPSEMLGSNAMKEFIKEVSRDYDTILFDAPPVGMVTDAAILSTMADGVIFTIAAKETPIDAIKHAKQMLEKVNANIIGVILNRVPQGSGGYYSYEYYQGYYEDETEARSVRGKRRTKK